MARMYSRKKGKSGSKKPIKKVIPTWIRYKPKEVELLITKLAKEGKTCSQIGTALRDVYGIPDVKTLTKKTIGSILKEKKLAKEIPEDLMALIKKAILIKKHIETNKQDQPAKRGLTITESKINKLISYYKKTNSLPIEWKYEPERIRFLIE